MNENEQDDTATPRAGGDVIWKSASQAGAPDDESNPSSPEDSESGTRAGGDVMTKSASQTAENTK